MSKCLKYNTTLCDGGGSNICTLLPTDQCNEGSIKTGICKIWDNEQNKCHYRHNCRISKQCMNGIIY